MTGAAGVTSRTGLAGWAGPRLRGFRLGTRFTSVTGFGGGAVEAGFAAGTAPSAGGTTAGWPHLLHQRVPDASAILQPFSKCSCARRGLGSSVVTPN